ncbi:Ig-like domain-containing domain [Flavitalea flava]
MKIKNGLLFFILFSLTITGAINISGCANIVPPLGGPRDTLPPRLLVVAPRDSTRHFTGNKIVFNFNEYIEAKELLQNLIVSPLPKVDPIVDAKLRTLTVRIKDTLQPNTTYSLDFGNSIRDVNEGNILKNFTYVFTTGNYIDSSQFSGNVIIASTGKVDSTLIVMLHRSHDDSAVIKERPRYIAKVDTTGRFRFHFLEPGTYYLFALKDEGNTRRYLSKGQLFAFADSPVVISRQTPPVTLYAYTEAAPDIKKPSTTAKNSTGTGKPATSKPSDKEKEKDKRLQFQVNITNGEFDILDTFRLQFTSSLKVFDTSKIRFTDGDFVDIAAGTYQFSADSTNKRFTLAYTWPTDTKFHLIAAKDFAQDSAGRKLLKIDTINFQTKKDIDYGEVRVRISNLDLSKIPVLQFVVQDVVKFSYPFVNKREFRVQLFPPGEYELRVLYDGNKNGVWDPGEFFDKHLQPEKVTPLRKKFVVKANWDNDVDITL